MSDDAGTVEVQQEETTTTPNQDFRNSELAQKTFSELKQLREEMAKIKDKEKTAQAEAERKRLEEEGNYKAALAQQEAELKKVKEQFAQERLQGNLKTELLKAGVTNDMFVKGAMADYSGDLDGIAEYVTGLKSDESNAVFFGDIKNPGIPPANGGNPASKATTKTEEELLAEGDPETMKKVFARALGQSTE
ncbi:MAG: hypothetical protein ACYTFK_13690 [Planctomycetota bacterium]|jgi:regulator of protease activity HflC (stomatin/prohibitin superfamily)